ncbi:glycosyltransferase [Aliikangiella marina]|uniref:Glycosyltransferase n=1 Tax=Aliikangiella marina TaxID=1712262 RepID=A0A545TCB2_9GAMM|nr:glycosyltransferase [Aliikangiella marina]TQV74858.1 glycosyltransferase [Aliikangiella marina]
MAVNNFLIFTKRVLPLSNTFVANQARFLKAFNPVFTGFSHDSSGQHLIENHQSCVLSDFSKFPKWDKFLLEGFSQVSKPWLKALETFKPKFIHAHFGKGGFYSGAIADALEIPLVVTFHGSDVTQKDRFSYNQKHREFVFKKAQHVIASSQFIADKLIARGCPEDKLTVHYIGIDNQFFKPSLEKSESPSVLFVGRLIEQKGCEYLLNAMHQVNKVIPQAQLLIAGDGVERKKLESIAAGLTNVKFLGPQNSAQIKTLLDKAWVMCAPSVVMRRGNEEGLGMVFLEAQAMGTPVVSFDTGGVSEAVKNDQTGILVEERSVDALAEGLLSLLSSSEKRRAFAAAGIERIEKQFNLEKQTRRFEQIYSSLID